MSYGADFATADPANAPLDPPLFIGADAFVWGAILLALAAALLLGWHLGSRGSSRRTDAARSIWSAIDSAAKDAMKADDNALKGRAEHLLKVVRNRLGAVLALSGGLSGRVGKLQDAVDGKAPDDGHGGPKPGHGKGHGHDDHKEPPKPHDAHEAAHAPGVQAPSAAANVTIVTVTPGAAAPVVDHGPRPGHHGPDPHGEHGKRDMTQREQTDALRLAVAAFNQHWRDENERVGELRAAHAELSGGGHGPSGRISGTRAGH